MATWSLLTGSIKSVSSAQALTEAGPPGASDGIYLSGLGIIQVELIAPNGQTFTGAGNIRGWQIFDLPFYPSAVWRRAPRFDDDLSDAAGLSSLVLPAVELPHQATRVALLADGVVVSGGSILTLNLLGFDRHSGMQV